MSDYDRFWDIHLTASNGWYDFAKTIRESALYHLSRQRIEGEVVILTSELRGAGIVHSFPVDNDRLPAKNGVVASCISIDNVMAHKIDDGTKHLVSWINDKNYKGKIRLNSHGDAGGHICMSTGRNTSQV